MRESQLLADLAQKADVARDVRRSRRFEDSFEIEHLETCEGLVQDPAVRIRDPEDVITEGALRVEDAGEETACPLRGALRGPLDDAANLVEVGAALRTEGHHAPTRRRRLLEHECG